MTGDILLRPFRDSDLESVRHLIEKTIDACYSGVYPPRAVAFFKEHHSTGNIIERSRAGDYFVLLGGGKLIATGSLAEGEISGVFVDPQFQRSGIGARMMRALEGRALENGWAEVYLDVSLPSRGFYERLGYQIMEERSIDVGGGERLDYWHASKRLVPSPDNSS
jgi:ribosomal protein S18 acetylase RimI-like enzyme